MFGYFTHWPKHEYRIASGKQLSSRLEDPDDPAGWFVNGGLLFRSGQGGPIRGERKLSLCRHEGPGVLTRI